MIKRNLNSLLLLIFIFLTLSCNDYTASKKQFNKTSDSIPQLNEIDSADLEVTDHPITYDYDTTEWNEILTSDNFSLDLRYATKQNFTNQKIYNCSRCFLKPIVAKKLKEINHKIYSDHGWRIILYDCYRPKSAQEKLWEIVPNPIYVTNPAKGSMHNRGTALDLGFYDPVADTIIDMGTDFDHFGREAFHSYDQLPSEIRERRKVLQDVMGDFGFKSITSEWWHYSLSGTGSPISDWKWPCLETNN